MPNHVANKLTFNGSKKEVAKLMKSVFTNGEFDFNTFSPRPDEISKTTSPCKIVSKSDYDGWVKKYEAATPDERESYSFPSPPITAVMQKKFLKKYGVDNWYDWSIKFWGTKWGAYETRDITDNSVYFDTAWATPYNAMLTLSEKFPKVEITVRFADEDFGHNCGEYTLLGGEMIDENNPDGGSFEAIEIATELQGDYNITDMLNELTAEELNEDWVLPRLEYALAHKELWKMYDETVLNKLLALTLSDERFELSSALQNQLKNLITK